jgi:hypothetical protein
MGFDTLLNKDTTNMNQQELEAHVRNTLMYTINAFHRANCDLQISSTQADSQLPVLIVKTLHEKFAPDVFAYTVTHKDNEGNLEKHMWYEYGKKRTTPILQYHGDVTSEDKNSYSRAYSLHNVTGEKWVQYRDRVVIDGRADDKPIIEPIIDRLHIYTTLASTRGRGTDDAALELCRRFFDRDTNAHSYDQICRIDKDPKLKSYQSDTSYHNTILYQKGRNLSQIRDLKMVIPGDAFKHMLIIDMETKDQLKIDFLGDPTHLRDWWNEVSPGLRMTLSDEKFKTTVDVMRDMKEMLSNAKKIEQVI